MDLFSWIVVIGLTLVVVLGPALFMGRPRSAREAGELHRSRTGNGWKARGER